MVRSVGSPARRLAGALSVAAVLAAVAGCGVLGGAAEETAGAAAPGEVEKSRIRLGLLPIIDVAPVHIAIRRGYFEQEGLEVEPITIQGGAAAIPGLVNGDLDMTFGNFVSFFAAQAKESAKAVGGLRLIMDGYQAKPEMFLVLAKADSDIESPKDLEGKTLGINTTRNIAELTFRATLEANNVDPGKVTFKEVPLPDMEAAVENGVVDAAFSSEPFITRAQRNSGQIAVLDAASGPTDGIPIAGYGTTGKFLQANPNTVAAFQRALVKGQRDAGDQPLVRQLLTEYAKVDSETAALVHFGEFPTTLDATRLQRVADLMKTYGLLETRFDVALMLAPAPGS
ncbi:NitT/TauT family transport system substrate-binding protein [Saccharothrix saharensis]|uniref:NitT/TauT family transport system substrate-binding protein n=1 Tax=Saccharothrix saharensis TaxID=571190 RepID=A0A543J983_9PSEU|nr:ABC transporter substrate-binding protein [Saccharothrix saharensis]TQM79354.1 NitT/TauT family transport system substrate-binding protein [Saccharothrix saharensis]